MSVAVAEPPRLFGAPGEDDGEGGAGAGPTLDDVLSGAWEGLVAHAAVACPVCGGEMTPRYGAGPAPVEGRCRDCHASLG